MTGPGLVTRNLIAVAALLVVPACGGDTMKLNDAVERLQPLVEELHGTAAGLALVATEVEVSSPRECREGLNERNGTGQVSLRYRVHDLDRGAADALVDAVGRRLAASGAEVEIRDEPDLDRRNLAATRGDERFSVDFAFSDGGSTATVSASTGCHEIDDV